MTLDPAARVTRRIVHALYGFWLAVYAVVFAVRPVAGAVPTDIAPGLLYGIFLGLAGACTAAGFLIGGKILDGAADGQNASAPAGALDPVGRARLGAILMAGLGEAGAALGFVHYVLTADAAKLAAFAVLAGAGYAFTLAKVNAAFARLRGSL